MKHLFILFIWLYIPFSVKAQYYTASEIETIRTNKSSNEGDLYMDTINNSYYIGITSGKLLQVNSDSIYISTRIAEALIDDQTMAEESSIKAPTQRSVKHYIDSVANVARLIENELFFNGEDHADAQYHNFYYVSMKADDGFIVIRYDKTNVNAEARSENVLASQPTTLNDIVGLTYN